MSPGSAADRPGRVILGPSTIGVLVVGAGCVATGGVLAGAGGAVSALLGTALVLVFLLLGQLPVAQAAQGRRMLGTALLLFGYTARVALLLIAFRVFRTADWVDADVLGVTVVLTALAWTATAVWAFLRWRPLYVDPELSPPPDGVPAAGSDRSPDLGSPR